ncbi:MAG: 5-oxoprolinase subunit PxpB [Gemmatimonadetes bacterium]|nr:5-oxoprolinase subunit PxpB [Gemmatimonadota bacterium]
MRLLSERVLLVEVGDPGAMDAITRARVRAVVELLRRRPVPGIIDIVPAYNTIALHAAGPLGDDVVGEVRCRLADLVGVTPPPGRLVDVPVRYGGADGPDLEELAAHAGLSASEVITLHAGAVYEVAMVGFSPGFPYLAGLPERLAMPRRTSPRTQVPAGSVAIGGRQTGIYPLASPGGWRLIGRTSVSLFSPTQDPPTLLVLGDRVRFVPEG